MNKKDDSTKREARETTHRRGAPRGPRKASQRRKHLLECAGSLFVKKGYEATTMDEIAAHAGFSKGTLYHYFSNKAELIQSLRQEFDTEIVRRIQINVEACTGSDWQGRLKAWITGAVKAYFAMSELHDVVIYGTGMPFRNSMAHSQVTRHLARLIADGAEAGAWSVDDDHWVAVMIFYAFRGACDEAMLEKQPPKEIPDRLHPLCLRMLGVDG